MSSNNINKYPENVEKHYLRKKKKINFSKIIKFMIYFAISCFIFYNLKLKNDELILFEKEIKINKNNIISTNLNIDNLKNKINLTKNEIDNLNKSQPELIKIKSIIKVINDQFEQNKKEEISKINEIQKLINDSKKILNKQISNNKIYEQEINKQEKTKENLIKEIGVLEDKYSKLQKEYLYLKEENKFNSKIIKTQEEYNTLKQFLSSYNLKLKLIYRLSKDGFLPLNFHNKVKNIKKTLILLLLKDGNKIGGFTSLSWDKIGFQSDFYSFLFNLNKKKIYPIQNSINSIYCTPNDFPTFGEGDLKIYSDKIQSNFPMSYSIESKKRDLTDGKEFVELIEFEVFSF